MIDSPTNYWMAFFENFIAAAAFLVYGFTRFHAPLPVAPLMLAIGFFAATLLEYAFHRWVMHGPPSVGQRGHIAHHNAPTALVSAPLFTVTVMALTILLLLNLILDKGVSGLLVAGLYAGYLHFAVVHHLQHRRNAWLTRFAHYRQMERLHHLHHHRQVVNFGITTTWWDRVFETFLPLKRTAPPPTEG